MGNILGLEKLVQEYCTTIPKDQRHEAIVNLFYEHIRRYMPYEIVTKHAEYTRNGYDGEFDIYAKIGKDCLYVEAKSSCHPRAISRAMQQFTRAALAFPEYRWTFYIATPSYIKSACIYQKKQISAA